MVALHEAAQTRYLNYALSVITSRALPDVRDGLKPVQRRILYTMWQQNLTADAKHRKCAKVVGDVMGNYHPHGDTALYETLVRMAQPFSLRYPLVDGSGNFGSLDGDGAAAMRYTECRLARLSDELLTEIDQSTVPFRPNYDGTKTEPVVLPSRVPNLLINGATGIAVGMATNIPPHNLNEVCTALIKLLDNPDLSSVQLCRYVKGPDFPTGGQMLNSPDELKEIYKTGSGAIRLRATWEEGPATRAGKTIYITSVPYTVNKSALVERIARRRGRPQAAAAPRRQGRLDRRRADRARVEEGRRREDGDGVPLQAHAAADELRRQPHVPRSRPRTPRSGGPSGSTSTPMLWHFLHFRLEVVTKRLEHELEAHPEAHPHPRRLREGLRRARRDPEDHPQVRRQGGRRAEDHEAVRARRRADRRDPRAEDLSPGAARDPRSSARSSRRSAGARARSTTLLKDEPGRWGVVQRRDRGDPEEVRRRAPDRRSPRDAGEAEYTAEDFIVEEDNVVIVSRDGWVKRQKEVKDVSSTRVREGDAVLAVLPGQHARHGRVLQQLRRRVHRRGSSTSRRRPATASRSRRSSS